MRERQLQSTLNILIPMAINTIEAVLPPSASEVPTLSRRRLLQGGAVFALSSVTPLVFNRPAAEARTSPDQTVELPSETPFRMGPGNDRIPGTNLTEFGTYAMLPQGTPIELNGLYNDFVRARATFAREKDGKTEKVTKNGFIYKGDVPSIPNGLPELTIEQVPWVKAPLVGKKGMEIEAGNPTPTEVTPYYRTVEDTDARIDVKMTGTGPVSDTDIMGLIIHNPEDTNTQLYSFLNVIRRDGYWALNHQQGDQWEEIAQLAGTDDVDATLRISKDGTTVIAKQGDEATDPIPLSVPLYTKTRILDFFGINTPADGSLKINQLNFLTPPSGKYAKGE